MDKGSNAFDGEVPDALLKHLLFFRKQGQRRAGSGVCGGGSHGTSGVIRRRIISKVVSG
jgi:hypothetical protein